MSLVIVDFGAGNLHSAERAFARAAEGKLAVVVSDRPEIVAGADRVVLPGDGDFGAAMAGLAARDGLAEALHEAVRVKARPFLGICVGMQMMVERSEERGSHAGLGWMKGAVHRIPAPQEGLRLPHMGWNDLVMEQSHPAVPHRSGDHAYFVHSYRVDVPQGRIAYVDYAGPTTAIIGDETMLGVQFHPEKSQGFGKRLIDAFLDWRP